MPTITALPKEVDVEGPRAVLAVPGIVALAELKMEYAVAGGTEK